MMGAMIGIVALLRLEHRELLAQVGGVLAREARPFGIHAVAVGAVAGGADRGLGGACLGRVRAVRHRRLGREPRAPVRRRAGEPQSRAAIRWPSFIENLLSIMILRAPWKAANCTLASVQRARAPSMSQFPNVRFLLSVAGVDQFPPRRGPRGRLRGPLELGQVERHQRDHRAQRARAYQQDAGTHAAPQLLRARARPAHHRPAGIRLRGGAAAGTRAMDARSSRRCPARRESCGPVPDRGHPARNLRVRTSSSSTGRRPPAGRCTSC